MILLKFLHLFLLANTVNCSIYWFFKSTTITPTPPAKENVINEELGIEESAEVVPPKPVVVLSESEDEEKKQFYNDMLAQSRRKIDLAAASRARYLAALPKEHDSMEMISAEASFANQFTAFVAEQSERINRVLDHIRYIQYGRSQYSDNEADEGYVVEEPESSTSSSSESDNVDEDEEAYLRYVVGEPIEKPVESEPVKSESDLVDDEENFEVIENAEESMNTLF